MLNLIQSSPKKAKALHCNFNSLSNPVTFDHCLLYIFKQQNTLHHSESFLKTLIGKEHSTHPSPLHFEPCTLYLVINSMSILMFSHVIKEKLLT